MSLYLVLSGLDPLIDLLTDLLFEEGYEKEKYTIWQKIVIGINFLVVALYTPFIGIGFKMY